MIKGAEKTVASVAMSWWSELTLDVGKSNAARAELRRAITVADAVMQAATQDLYARLLTQTGVDLRHRADTLGALAMTLAQVRENSPLPLARLMGQGDPATVSGIRFERIIRAGSVADLAPMLRRILPLVGHQCSVVELANDILFWGGKTRQNWCFHYYNATPLGADQPIEEGQDA